MAKSVEQPDPEDEELLEGQRIVKGPRFLLDFLARLESDRRDQ